MSGAGIPPEPGPTPVIPADLLALFDLSWAVSGLDAASELRRVLSDLVGELFALRGDVAQLRAAVEEHERFHGQVVEFAESTNRTIRLAAGLADTGHGYPASATPSLLRQALNLIHPDNASH